ncbi:hypothetical protein [Butyrivibrio sp. INlla16]|uniref:hypothetical protein n=1 Tax=Butyrivibrio sp. INlla16 TaxID=1520807 RepID=UPI00088DCCA3|nr:hypothetical protein [Butyrivibrio sp. INlla16]SDB64258.1 hypothetical protein SAMN02910263_03571 [Butyrivibrio sp. INlla16]
MTPKVLLFIVLIAVLAPVYLLFGVATSKNIKDMSEKNKEEYEKNRAKHRYMLLGQCWGMGIGVIAGCIANYCISGKVSTGMCLGTSFGMLAGMAIGAMLDRRKMEQETEQ